MIKKFRIIIITALLLGLLLPAVDYYYELEDSKLLTKPVKVEAEQAVQVEYFLELAQKSFYKGDYNAAEDYYKQVIKLDPFNLNSRKNLAVIYTDQNKLFKKNEILLELAILSDRNSDYLNLALNFYELNNNSASNFILLNKVKAEFEDSYFTFQYYYYLIKNNLELEKLKLAEKYLKEIDKLQINQAEVYLLKAELNKKRLNFKQAYENYYKSYQKQRSQSYLFKDMAEMLEKNNKEIKAYKFWQKTLAYGWFEDLAESKIAYYQEKYPELDSDSKSDKQPAEINPFALEANWKKLKNLESDFKNSKSLRIGLEEQKKRLLFQYSNSFSIVQSGKILFRGEAKKNYLLKIEGDSIYLQSQTGKIKLGSSKLEYQFYSNQKNSSFYIYNINYGQGYFWQGRANRQYRGQMIIKGNNNNFTLINQLGLTPYLSSVVPSEIYASWPLEALKAQAVAARSYTLSNLGRHSHQGYDLCSSVHCAAYNGIVSENQKTTKAVLATKGESAIFNGQIIKAVFSSNSGGFTERSDQIWSQDLPYLRGSNQMKTDKFSFPLAPFELKNWILTAPKSYSKDFRRKNYRWQIRVPARVIEYNSGLENIKKIEVKKRAQAGTITALTIYGDQAKKTYNVSAIRRVLGGLKNSRFYFDSYYDKDNNLKGLYIYGSGWGHNLGLDQSAAAGMAADGWNYQKIIKHFYPGVEIKNH